MTEWFNASYWVLKSGSQSAALEKSKVLPRMVTVMSERYDERRSSGVSAALARHAVDERCPFAGASDPVSTAF
jgi:hypothetical protein